MTPLIQPFWFKQRQAKLEQAGENKVKVSAPNQGDAYLLIRQGDNHKWQAAVRATVDGSDVAESPPEFSSPAQAWEAAFELYRRSMVC